MDDEDEDEDDEDDTEEQRLRFSFLQLIEEDLLLDRDFDLDLHRDGLRESHECLCIYPGEQVEQRLEEDFDDAEHDEQDEDDEDVERDEVLRDEQRDDRDGRLDRLGDREPRPDPIESSEPSTSIDPGLCCASAMFTG